MGAPCNQLDLFAAQGVASYGDQFDHRKTRIDRSTGERIQRAPDEQVPDEQVPGAKVLGVGRLIDRERGTYHPLTKPGTLGDDRPHWFTRAWQHGGQVLAYPDTPPPIELKMDGMDMVICFGFGFGVYAASPPGSPFISDTGFRSFAHASTTQPQEIWQIIRDFIDAPPKDGNGLGGQLKRWVPHQARAWSEFQSRKAMGWYGKAPQCLDIDEQRAQEARAWMEQRGLDPYALFPDCKPPAQGALL